MEAVVLLSGGIDSATCLFLAAREGYSLRALTIEIHETARAELRAAMQVGKRAGVVEHRFVSIPELREAGDISGSRVLSKQAVPPTYIPMKNAIYYSLAAGFAEEKGAACLIGGHNQDDRAFFEDTSDQFFADLRRTFLAASPRLSRSGLEIRRPLQDMRKPQIVALAADLGVPLELTWSCHRAGEQHCWRCAGCAARVAAFEAAGIDDPLKREEGKG